ncbi:MAG: hypothetical protein FJ119_12115 [Deltaproteobacteria bacterium]|nr:hypothetical protein [Deltaproteobacteria bacterium]
MTGGKGWKVTTDKVARVMQDIKAMTADDLFIGIPASNTNRKDGAMTNAAIGYQNEYGSAVNNIPPRPFLVPGVDAVRDTVTAEIAKGLGRSFNNPSAMATALERSGIKAVNSVKAHIRKLGKYPADSPTVRARKAKGFKGTAILRVTGSLINSITYVVKRAK